MSAHPELVEGVFVYHRFRSVSQEPFDQAHGERKSKRNDHLTCSDSTAAGDGMEIPRHTQFTATITTTLLLPALTMTSAQSTAAPADFDFEIGSWRVKHLRLKERLVGCTEWTEFDGDSTTQKILGGFGNLEDNHLALPEGPYRAVALRSFNAASKQWSIWWLDGRNPGVLDVPVVGGFADGKGLFYANDILNGKPIKVRFTWCVPEPDRPRWEQAFSANAGATWETNWTMDFTRVRND